MRVLIVEDEMIVGRVFVDYLEALGHTPILAPTVEAALEELRRERPDAIFLDLHLPGMPGLDFLPLCDPQESDIPIVVISGGATDEQIRDCLRFGAFEFLAKPVSLDRMAKLLQSLDSRRRVADRIGSEDRSIFESIPVTVPVRITTRGGLELLAHSKAVSRFGLKVDAQISMRPDEIVNLWLTFPGGNPPVELSAFLVRDEPDGQAFCFVSGATEELTRLEGLLERARERQGGP